MNDEQKQELLGLFNKTPYLSYYETLNLFKSFIPERSKLIIRMLNDDIQQFKLKIYFWETQGYGGPFPLLTPEYVTADTLQYHVPPPPENYANFWVFGKLSTQELKDWLQSKDTSDSFFKIPANKASTDIDDKLTEHLGNLATNIKGTSPQRQKPEITQKVAAELLKVDIRTIRNWDKGRGASEDYPGRQSRVSFMMFVSSRENERRFMKEARAINRARPSGDMSEFSEDEKF